MKKWVKIPGPRQFRGEGEWTEVDGIQIRDADYDLYRTTGFLPTRESDTKPDDQST